MTGGIGAKRDDAAASIATALAAFERNDVVAGVDAFRRAGTLDPRATIAYALALPRLGERIGTTIGGSMTWHSALRALPNDLHAALLLGACLRTFGNDADAIRTYERLAQLPPPGRGPALVALAHLHLARGNRPAAIAALRGVLSVAPDTAWAWYHLARCDGAALTDEHFRLLETLLERSGEVPDAVEYLHFALGHGYDAHGRRAEAHDHFVRANAAHRRAHPFDVTSLERRAQAVIERCTPERIAAGARLVGGPAPVFVAERGDLGAERVAALITEHPNARRSPVRDLLAQCVQRADDRAGAAFPAWFGADDETCTRLAAEYLTNVEHAAGDAPVVVDTDAGNAERFAAIAALVPAARLIAVRGEPSLERTTCFTTRYDDGRFEERYDLGDLERSAAAYDAIVAHWRRVLPGRVLEVDLADADADPAGTAARIRAFCGLAERPSLVWQ